MAKKRPVKAAGAAARSTPSPKEVQPSEPPIRGIGLEEFVRRLRAETNAEKHFALFLGAGCSVTSGIPSAGELVKGRWIPRLRDYQAPGRSDLDKWAAEVIQDYDPAHPALSYGELIDRLFLTPEDRQREIEDLCEGRTPFFRLCRPRAACCSRGRALQRRSDNELRRSNRGCALPVYGG